MLAFFAINVYLIAGGIGDRLLSEVVVLSGSWHMDCFIGRRG